MVKIATIYSNLYTSPVEPYAMDTVRWLRISEAFAALGYEVDMIINNHDTIVQKGKNLRFVSNQCVRFEDYDVIKTVFHGGVEFLVENNAGDHPFIISKLGSVVGGDDNVEGVYFFNDIRKNLYRIQETIVQKSRYVTLLTKQSIDLWQDEFGLKDNILHLPTGVEKDVPNPVKNPYSECQEKIAVYIGNIYSLESGQRDVNLMWQKRLNILGRLLKKKGIRLFFIGKGAVDKLDKTAVTYLGVVNNNEIYDYQHFADVGIVFAQGEIQHNESSKLYYYLWAGLPVVSEQPVPNNDLIKEANLGFIVPYDDNPMMAEMIEKAAYSQWDKQYAIDYMLKHHTWESRVRVYDELIKEELQ